jgi:hypothetical protein
MHHPSVWIDLLFAAWFSSGVFGAALLGAANRAGTGFLLGILGGPIGVVIAYRMNRAAPAGGTLPRDGRYGANILTYRPAHPPPAAAFAWPVVWGVTLVAYSLARPYYGRVIFWPLLLVAILVAHLLGLRLGAGSALPVVAVFEKGVVIGDRFAGWSDLEKIEYHPSVPEPAPRAAASREPQSAWLFTRRLGAPMYLSVPTPGYVNVSELNALLQARASLRIVTPESPA